MRDLFIAAGRRPVRTAPHYFVLGRSAWFEGLADDMDDIVLAVDALPADATSFTYPDSFTAMGLGPIFGLPYEPRPYHHQVFRLDELPDVIERFGLPPDAPADYERYVNRPFEMYVEVQVWTDGPIRHFLQRGGPHCP